MREILLVLHVAGVVLWVGGSAVGAWTAARLALAPVEARKVGLGAVRSALLALTMPGILLAWGAGLTMFLTALDVYARAGWMHGKLTIGIVVAALHGVLVGRVRRAAGDVQVPAATFAGLAMGIVALAVVAIALVLLRPGS